jgi:hypothetical protein
MTFKELFPLAADHLWQSTLFGAAAAIVALLLKRHSASVRYWVWFAGSAKFLVPFAASSRSAATARGAASMSSPFSRRHC